MAYQEFIKKNHKIAVTGVVCVTYGPGATDHGAFGGYGSDQNGLQKIHKVLIQEFR